MVLAGKARSREGLVGILVGGYEMVGVGELSDVYLCLSSCSIFGRAFWVYHQKRTSFFFFSCRLSAPTIPSTYPVLCHDG